MEENDLKEANELIWENCLQRAVRAAGKAGTDIVGDKKSARWKIWIASELKRHTSAPGTWIAEKLNRGAPQLVSTYVNRLRREIDQHPDPDYETFISKYTDPFLSLGDVVYTSQACKCAVMSARSRPMPMKTSSWRRSPSSGCQLSRTMSGIWASVASPSASISAHQSPM